MTGRKREIVRDLRSGLAVLAGQMPHILGLRFPYFRNFAPNAEVRFTFPITVILGRNGTNKSSLLHALWGAPERNTVAKFWFETDLDGIPRQNGEGLKPSVVHSYLDRHGNEVQCIKARAPRHKEGDLDPDYWETVKPTEPYGFPKESPRTPPIRIQAIHLDFRGMLPAFDRYFYFPSKQHLSARSAHAKRTGKLRREYRPQDYLRRRTKGMRELIHDKGIKLPDNELKILSYILEREYTAGTILRHDRFHGHEGWTLLFETSHLEKGYSEAFAGSGESAAAMLVREVEEAPSGSILLLDEPETSLHPRAQQRMLEFLVDRAGSKNLQIVIASHSTEFARLLPQTAIRVLRENQDRRIEVDDRMTAAEALHEMSDLPRGKTILVEDERTRDVVLASLKVQSTMASDEFNVLVRPGGVGQIYRDIAAYCIGSRGGNLFVVFDGDQSPSKPVPDDRSLPQGLGDLKELVSELTKGNDARGPDPKFDSAAHATQYIQFLRTQVFYLPAPTPELLVWDEAAAQRLMGSLPGEIAAEPDGKKRLAKLASKVPPYKDSYIFDALLRAFLEGNSPWRTALEATIRQIRGA